MEVRLIVFQFRDKFKSAPAHEFTRGFFYACPATDSKIAVLLLNVGNERGGFIAGADGLIAQIDVDIGVAVQRKHAF